MDIIKNAKPILCLNGDFNGMRNATVPTNDKVIVAADETNKSDFDKTIDYLGKNNTMGAL